MTPRAQQTLIGQVIDGRYEILQRIGEGGMGVVYKAKQTSIDRVIAIKMLNQHLAKDPNWVKRFYNEAKACSRLQHPNTIRMFDFGQTNAGQLFMTMEYLDGQSLRDAVASTSPMAPARVLKILVQCCASLSEAHNQGIIHRDIKPDNVFLLNIAGSPDYVKLLDFSVAKLLQENEAMRTQAGVVFGTPQYMSPEQGRGVPLDARSDLYALGILGYEMLTGRVPFTDENPMSVLQMHLRSPVPSLPGNVPASVQNLINRALDKDPAGRFPSASAMMQQCQQVLATLPSGPPGAMPRLQPAAPGAVTAPNPERARNVPGFGAEAKTMIADDLPGAGGGGGAGGPGKAEQKTIMADSASLLGGLGGASGAPPAQGGPPPSHGAPPPAAFGASSRGPGPQGPPGGGVPQKTMLLENSEGIVSYASQLAAQQRQQQRPPTGVHRGAPPVQMRAPSYVAPIEDGASAGFWVVSLALGIGVGVGAYFLFMALV